NIVIYEVSSLVSAVTDGSGGFSFEVPSQFEKLGISFNNRSFEDTIIFIAPRDQKLSINLTPAPKSTPTEKLENLPMHQPQVDSLPLVQRLVSDQLFVRTENMDMSRPRTTQTSFLPRLGTDLNMSGLIENKVSLNLLAGYA